VEPLSWQTRGVNDPALAAKLAPEWAPFPTLAGRSFYAKPVKRFTSSSSSMKAILNAAGAMQIIRANDIAAGSRPWGRRCSVN